MKRIIPAVTLLLTFASFLLPTNGKTQEILFPRVLFYSGNDPEAIAVGDFNGDGRPDIVTANFSGSNVGVLLANGNGTFAPRAIYHTGFGAHAVAVGDFNRDGKPDIVTANQYTNTISVLINNGDGTFAANVDYASGVSPSSVAVGDFNGDGKLDIVVSNADVNSPTISVLLNNGNGTFAAKVDYSVVSQPTSVTVGDFNGDGKLDIAVAGLGTKVSILLNNGNGTFASKGDYATDDYPNAIATGDFDGDGKLDIVTTNQGSASGSVSVLFGKGDGTFVTKVDYAVGYHPKSAAVGDFNGDGKLDIVTSQSVLLNNGNGTFSTGFTGVGGVGVAIGDFNGDGKLDIATAGGSNAFYVTALFNTGNGNFMTQATYPVDFGAASVVTGDFNGDGNLDMVTTSSTYGTLSVLLNNGDGTFAQKIYNMAGAGSQAATVGDFNGDGKLDIATCGPYYGTIFLGKGDGTFASPTYYKSGSAYFGGSSVAVGDFNGDGKIDIVTANNGTNTNYNGGINIFLNKGNGTFAAQVAYPTGNSPVAVAVGDFNGDGRPDVVTANKGLFNSATGTYNGNTVSVLLNNGNGTFAAKADYTTGFGPVAVAVGDFNGDGKLDIITANYSSASVSILFGNGDGTFAAKMDCLASGGIGSVAVGDFDGDSIPDIAVTGERTNILINKGDGTFALAVGYAIRTLNNSMTVGDFNKDGKLDIVTVSNDNPGTVSVLLNLAARSRVSGLLTLEGISPASPAQLVTFTFRTLGFPDFAPTLNVAPSGNFSVNLPKRSGTLHIKGSKYLAANVSVDATAGDVSGLAAMLAAGDANNDNSIDSSDFGVLIGAFNTDARIPGSGYDATADLNGDGFVDSTDFGILIGNYGQTGASP